MLFAACLGFFSAEVGVSIQHDANHGAYSNNPSLNKYFGCLLDVVGASSYMWKQQHVIGHHVYTNVDGLDPDIRVKDPDVRRVTMGQPWRAYQVGPQKKPSQESVASCFCPHIQASTSL